MWKDPVEYGTDSKPLIRTFTHRVLFAWEALHPASLPPVSDARLHA